MNHSTVHISEPSLDAVVIEGEFFVIDSEEVQDGGVEVVDLNRILGDVIADFIGLAEAEPRL